MASAYNMAFDTVFSVDKTVPKLEQIGNGWSFQNSEEMKYVEAVGIRARALAYHALCRLGLDPAIAICEVDSFPEAHCHKIVTRTIVKYQLHKRQLSWDL